MTIISFVPCYAPHVPQDVAESLFGPLNKNMISSTASAEILRLFRVAAQKVFLHIHLMLLFFKSSVVVCNHFAVIYNYSYLLILFQFDTVLKVIN